MKKPSHKCCKKPNVKNTGFKKFSSSEKWWNWSCSNCNKTWDERGK